MGRMLPLVLGVALVVVGYQLWNRNAAEAGALDYVSDWTTAVAEARASGKPILLNFGGSW